MVGRAAYSHPYIWSKIDSMIYGQKEKCVTRSNIIKKIIPYTEKHIENVNKVLADPEIDNWAFHFWTKVNDPLLLNMSENKELKNSKYVH